ncbi:MAG: DUF3107 domain-containing protein [Nocardioidaceae bacterium]
MTGESFESSALAGVIPDLRGRHVEVKIGVAHASRELSLELSQSADEIHKAVTEALTADHGLLEFTDEKGRTFFIPAEKLAYVELSGGGGRRVGFGVT